MIIKSYKGFTVVEILIVVFIIVLVLSMALPNYLKARRETRKQACISNLWQLNEAIKQWALENDINEGESLSGYEDEIYEYLRFGAPTCPSSGTYIFGDVGDEPHVTCSKAESLGHELQ